MRVKAMLCVLSILVLARCGTFGQSDQSEQPEQSSPAASEDRANPLGENMCRIDVQGGLLGKGMEDIRNISLVCA
jgi:hypothetical protein